MTRQFKSYLFSNDRRLCTGCGACACVCPHSAIMMKENDEGFIFPVRNENKCTHCGLCDLRCPATGRNMKNIEYVGKPYIAFSKLHSYSLNCATIGVCTMCAEFILDNKGIVFGVELDGKTLKTNHIKVSKHDNLQHIQNSKYVQSDTGDTFHETKILLEKGTPILYVGTPCQIAGLKSYLSKDYPNLYTIDLVCHGTFSYKLMVREVEYWEHKFKGKVVNFKFRSKSKYDWIKGGVVNFDIVSQDGKTKHIERPGCCSPTYHCFAYSKDTINYNLRECCYGCHFRDKERYGDLTVGDAWGIISHCPGILTASNKRFGISVLIANTKKGNLLIDAIRDKITLEPTLLDIAFSQPALLPSSREIPKLRYTIYSNAVHSSDSYDKMIENALNVNLSKEYFIFSKNLFVEKVKTFIKSKIYDCKRQ